MTPRENFINFFNNKSYEWIPNGMDLLNFRPTLIPDNISRGLILQQEAYTGPLGGKDFFGVEWVFDPAARGAMEVEPLFDDIEEWEDYVVFPDLDALSWEACAKENKEYLNTDKMVYSTIYTGFFERLISFVGFENAAIALIDEDQKESVHKLFDKLADTYIKLIANLHKYFNVELVELHDDWGTQRGTMFSVETHREMLMPYIKKVVDGAHWEGVFIELHSCGKIDELIPNVLETGVDTWKGQSSVIDRKQLVRQFGDKFKFGADIRINEKLPDDAVMELTQNLVSEYRGKRIWIPMGPYFTPEQKRMMYDYIKSAGIKR